LKLTVVKLNCEIIESTIKTIHVPFLFPAGALIAYCKDKTVNVLKLEKSVGDKNFKLTSFCPDLKVDENAEMNCIVIELKVINS